MPLNWTRQNTPAFYLFILNQFYLRRPPLVLGAWVRSHGGRISSTNSASVTDWPQVVVYAGQGLSHEPPELLLLLSRDLVVVQFGFWVWLQLGFMSHSLSLNLGFHFAFSLSAVFSSTFHGCFTIEYELYIGRPYNIFNISVIFNLWTSRPCVLIIETVTSQTTYWFQIAHLFDFQMDWQTWIMSYLTRIFKKIFS